MLEIFKTFTLILSIISIDHAYDIRIDCHPDKGSTQARCLSRGCVWQPKETGIPWCIFDRKEANVAGYDGDSLTAAGGLLKRRNTPSIFGDDQKKLSISIHDLTADIFSLEISAAEDSNSSAEEDSIEISDEQNFDTNNQCTDSIDPEYCEEELYGSKYYQESVSHSHGKYEITMQKKPFGLAVTRKSEDPCERESPIFDTRNIPGLTFSKHFIQISTRVPTSNVYGIGEQYHEQLRRDFNWRRLSLFNKDQYPVPNSPLYGAHPFYIGLDARNQSFGVFVETTYPMDVYLQPNPELLTFRIIGGENIKLHFFMGPMTDNVIEQYTWLVGRPLLPPYWSLGFHLSRFGYNSLDNLKKVYDRNRAAHIPQDTQWLDIDYLEERKDFTISKNFTGLNVYVNSTIHGSERKLVVIVDPAIPSNTSNYDPLKYGLDLDVFIKDAQTGKPLQGRVWPGATYFPDFTNPKTTAYWRKLMENFHTILNYDGIWIDMNDPSNFVDGSVSGCATNSLNNPPFLPVNYEPLYQKTICMDALQYAGPHLQWHNQYGHLEAKATYQALAHSFRSRRTFVLTRSTAPGSGSFAAHWLGDTESTWSSLSQSMIGSIEFNMFGIPMTGADICGFNKNTTEELCKRWSQLGAFYPFARNHNTDNGIDQDPAVWPEQTRNAIKQALQVRYSLLPYLYTLFYRAHIQGTPVLRAMFYDYPTDALTWNMHEQFLWGQALLIAPILKPNTDTRNVYFPKGIWYHLMGRALTGSKQGRWRSVPMHNITDSLFIRGGHIIPSQAPAETTAQSRRNPFGLLVGLQLDGTASGQLYWDDGDNPKAILQSAYCLISFSTSQLTSSISHLSISASQYQCAMSVLDSATIMGVVSAPSSVKVNGQVLASTYWKHDDRLQILTITHLKLKMNTKSDSEIVWQ